MDRLEAIVSLVENCNAVADIGTDHGYVAEMLLKQKICDRVIATDINKGPLNSAISHLTSICLNDRVDFRLGGGLTVLSENEVNAVVIAGMGGELINKILEDSKNIVKKLDFFVIQPMTNIDTVRKYLYSNGYSIEEEIIVKELYHYYFIMKVKNKNQEIDDDIYFKISKYLLGKKDLLFLEYIKKLISTNNNILENLQNARLNNTAQRVEYIINKNKRLEEFIKEYEG